MSRGLGKHQRTILAKLHQLETDREQVMFPVSQVLETFASSPTVQQFKARRDQESAEFWTPIREEADKGDHRSQMLILIAESIRNSKSRRGRKVERKVIRDVESLVNPSRTLALLERRGLVKRQHGWVGLTEAGWKISVG